LFYIYLSVLTEESDKNLTEDSKTVALTSAKGGLRKEKTNTVGKKFGVMKRGEMSKRISNDTTVDPDFAFSSST
jgi:hypothetical protein